MCCTGNYRVAKIVDPVGGLIARIAGNIMWQPHRHEEVIMAVNTKHIQRTPKQLARDKYNMMYM
jgi:hypothetical protein